MDWNVSICAQSSERTLTRSLLPARGYELTFRAPNEERPLLAEYDIPNYDHVVFFTPTTKCESVYMRGITPLYETRDIAIQSTRFVSGSFIQLLFPASVFVSSPTIRRYLTPRSPLHRSHTTINLTASQAKGQPPRSPWANCHPSAPIRCRVRPNAPPS